MHLLAMLALSYAIWLAYEPIHVMLSYEETQGRILSLGQEKVEQASEGEDEAPETAYKPVVEYEFIIGGTRYTGKRYDFADRGDTPEWAESVLRNYSVGSSVTVYFNPVHPERAVLAKQIPRSILGVMCLSAIIGGFLLMVSVLKIQGLAVTRSTETDFDR